MTVDRQNIVFLRNALQDLMNFLCSQDRRKIPYYFRYLDYMKNNIEIYLYTGDDNIEHLEKVLQKHWNEANDQIFGIPAYGVDEYYDEHQEICMQYIQLLSEVARYFQMQ